MLDETEPFPVNLNHYLMDHWPREHKLIDLSEYPHLVFEALKIVKEKGAVTVDEFDAEWRLGEDVVRGIFRAATRIDPGVAYGMRQLYKLPASV